MQLYGLHMKRGTHIQDHLYRLDELANQPAAIGEEVSEGSCVTLKCTGKLLNSCCGIARGDDDLTLVFVKQALLDEEQRRGKPWENDPATANGNSALKAAHKFSNKKQKPGTGYGSLV